MIRLNSPYYVTIPWVSPATALTSDDYTLYLFVWTGLKASVPGTATWSKTKINSASSTGDDKVDISQIIKSELADTITPQVSTSTGLIDAVNRVWVQWEVTYTTTNPTDASTPQLTTIKPAGLGYTLGDEGENQEDAEQRILKDSLYDKLDRNGVACIPIFGSQTLATNVTAISYPNNELNFAGTVSASTDTDDLVQLLYVAGSDIPTDRYLEVELDVVSKNSIKIFNLEEEFKYTPTTFLFMNRYGSEETATFFKENRASTQVMGEVFQRRDAQPSTGSHQYKTFNKKGRRSNTYFSGWVHENTMDGFEQMFLSEYVWRIDGTDAIPVEVISSNIDRLTRENTKFIQLEIRVSDAFELINNV